MPLPGMISRKAIMLGAFAISFVALTGSTTAVKLTRKSATPASMAAAAGPSDFELAEIMGTRGFDTVEVAHKYWEAQHRSAGAGARAFAPFASAAFHDRDEEDAELQRALAESAAEHEAKERSGREQYYEDIVRDSLNKVVINGVEPTDVEEDEVETQIARTMKIENVNRERAQEILDEQKVILAQSREAVARAGPAPVDSLSEEEQEAEELQRAIELSLAPELKPRDADAGLAAPPAQAGPAAPAQPMAPGQAPNAVLAPAAASASAAALQAVYAIEFPEDPMSNREIQVDSRQDMVRQGTFGRDGADGVWTVLCDGHGGHAIINRLRGADWNSFMNKPSFSWDGFNSDVQDWLDSDPQRSMRVEGTGATISAVRLDRRTGKVHVAWMGDSDTAIYFTKQSTGETEEVWRSQGHDYLNEAEVARFKQEFGDENIFGGQKNFHGLTILDDRSLTMKPQSSAYFEFGSYDSIAMTRALGHRGLTSKWGLQTDEFDAADYTAQHGPGFFQVVTGSDGLWDMVHEGENENPINGRVHHTDAHFLGAADVDATAIAKFAEARWKKRDWRQMFNGAVHGITGLGLGDDISVGVIKFVSSPTRAVHVGDSLLRNGLGVSARLTAPAVPIMVA